MRGFSYGEINVLYNGISIGPQSITSRVMDTSSLDRVEFLKGPSAIMSGLDAIGGSVNYVSNQPTTGAIKNELDTSINSLGTYRTHFGSGGSTSVQGLDYRVDIGQSKINSFIDGDYENLTNFSGQFNYRVTDSFKVFGAIEYKQDQGHAYWGTPLTTTTFSGPFSVGGVVSGFAINAFDGVSVIAPVTVDSRTLTTNYNVADNSVGAHELWLRSGFEWAVNNDVTVKNQVYDYRAQRHWIDSEQYVFDAGAIDRNRFFVTHNQHVFGNNSDFIWNSSFFGMENRLAAQLQVSRNDITFGQEDGDIVRHGVRGQSVPGTLRPDADGHKKQPSRHPCRIGRGPPQDQLDVLLDRRRPVRGFPAAAEWRQLRRLVTRAGSPSPRPGPRCLIAPPIRSSR